MEYKRFYRAQTGHQTYRIQDDPLPRLCVVCDRGRLGDVCAEVYCGTTVEEIAQAVAASAKVVEVLAATGCPIHGTAPVELTEGQKLDALVASTPPAVIAAAIRAHFAPPAPGAGEVEPIVGEPIVAKIELPPTIELEYPTEAKPADPPKDEDETEPTAG